jgi:hypothetical protein
MYAGVLDWAEIFAELLHRPRVNPQTLRTDPEEPSGLPAAVAMALPDGDSTDPTPDMVAQAVEAVCHRGWLRREFDRATTRSRLNNSSNGTPSGDLPADLDLGLRRNGARTELLAVVAEDEGRMAAGQEVYNRLNDLVAHGEVRVPALNVRRIGAYAIGEVQDDRSFIASICQDPGSFSIDVFSAEAQVSKRHLVQRHVLTLPAGTSVDPAESVTVQPSDSFIATRVDVSGTLTPKDLKLFALDKEKIVTPPVEDTSVYN